MHLRLLFGFRSNSAYARWWEARSAWAGIAQCTRVFARLIIAFTDSYAHQPNYTAPAFPKDYQL